MQLREGVQKDALAIFLTSEVHLELTGPHQPLRGTDYQDFCGAMIFWALGNKIEEVLTMTR